MHKSRRIIPDYPDKVIINIKPEDPAPRFEPAISENQPEAEKTDAYRLIRLGVPSRLEKTRIAVAMSITAIGVAAGVILLTDKSEEDEAQKSHQSATFATPPQKPETIIPVAAAQPTSVIAEPPVEPIISPEPEEQVPATEASAVAVVPKETTKKIPPPTRKYKTPEDIYDDFDAKPVGQKPKKPVKSIPGDIVREVPF